MVVNTTVMKLVILEQLIVLDIFDMLHHNYLKDVSITCFYGINFTNNIITKYDINGNKHCFGDESNNYTVHDD